MRDAISHRSTRPIQLIDEALVSYDPRNAIDDFLDAGGSFIHAAPRAFPEGWKPEAVGYARWFYASKAYMTELRAAEMGVSRTYERHQYAPSWNAPLFPEIQILAACGVLTRCGETKKKRKRQAARPGAGGKAQTA